MGGHEIIKLIFGIFLLWRKRNDPSFIYRILKYLI